MGSQETGSKNYETDIRSLFLLSGVCLLAILLRLNQAGVIPLRADEAANYYLALKPPNAIIRPLIASDPHLPLYFIILHFWMLFAGSSELSVRYVTMFFAVLVIPLVYALGKRLFPRSNTGLIAAFLAAINPYSIWDAQDAYMYTMLTATSLASLVTFFRLGRPKANWLAWAAYIGITSISLYEHYLAGLVILAEGTICVWWAFSRAIQWRRFFQWVGSLLVISAIFTPWLAMVVPLLSSLDKPIWRPVGLWELLARTFVAFSLGRAQGLGMPAMVEQLAGILGTIPFLVLFGIGIFASSRSFKSDLNQRVLLVLYLFVPLLAFFIFTLVRFPVFDERYVLFLIPPFVLLTSRGVVVLQERAGLAIISAATLALIVALTIHSLYNYWYVPAFTKSPDWPGFVATVEAESLPGDVLIQNYPDAALPYYLHADLPTVLVPGRSAAQMPEVGPRLDGLSKKYDRIWFQPVVGGNWDSDGIVATWLDRHAEFLRAYSFRGLRLQLFESRDAAIRNARPVNTTFANGVHLVAFNHSLENNQGRGKTVRFVLFWQATMPETRDATVFVHLYDERGRLVAQLDNQPVQGAYPTHEWGAGEIVVDSHDLEIPADLASGEYSVVVGMYDSERQERIAVLDSSAPILPDNRVVLVNLDLKR